MLKAGSLFMQLDVCFFRGCTTYLWGVTSSRIHSIKTQIPGFHIMAWLQLPLFFGFYTGNLEQYYVSPRHCSTRCVAILAKGSSCAVLVTWYLCNLTCSFLDQYHRQIFPPIEHVWRMMAWHLTRLVSPPMTLTENYVNKCKGRGIIYCHRGW